MTGKRIIRKLLLISPTPQPVGLASQFYKRFDDFKLTGKKLIIGHLGEQE